MYKEKVDSSAIHFQVFYLNMKDLTGLPAVEDYELKSFGYT